VFLHFCVPIISLRINIKMDLGWFLVVVYEMLIIIDVLATILTYIYDIIYV
jgi:hypothetical protein